MPRPQAADSSVRLRFLRSGDIVNDLVPSPLISLTYEYKNVRLIYFFFVAEEFLVLFDEPFISDSGGGLASRWSKS